MTGQDRATFAEALHALGEAFNEPVSDIRSEAYFYGLSDFTIDQVNMAVRLALRACKFFPKPVELRELILGDSEANADAAWSEVIAEISRVGYMGEPKFMDERALVAIRDIWGSWRRLCETLPAEGPELVGWIKQFKGAYRSVSTRVEQQASMAGLPPDLRARLSKIADAHGWTQQSKLQLVPKSPEQSK